MLDLARGSLLIPRAVDSAATLDRTKARVIAPSVCCRAAIGSSMLKSNNIVNTKDGIPSMDKSPSACGEHLELTVGVEEVVIVHCRICIAFDANDQVISINIMQSPKLL